MNKAAVSARLKELKAESGTSDAEEQEALKNWLKLNKEEAAKKKELKSKEAELDARAYAKYPQLSEAEIQTLVVDDKWLTCLAVAVQGELDRVSQTLTGRIRLLADRYGSPLPQIVDEVAALSVKVDAHLKKMEAQA